MILIQSWAISTHQDNTSLTKRDYENWFILELESVTTELWSIRFLISEQYRLQNQINGCTSTFSIATEHQWWLVTLNTYIHKHHYILGTYREHSNMINFGDCFHKSLGIDIDTDFFPYFERTDTGCIEKNFTLSLSMYLVAV